MQSRVCAACWRTCPDWWNAKRLLVVRKVEAGRSGQFKMFPIKHPRESLFLASVYLHIAESRIEF